MLSVAFCEFLSKFTHTGHIYLTSRVGANKGLHDFSMKKEVILIFLLLEHCSSLVTGITHFICCGSQKTKFMVLLFLCWLHMLESYI